MKRKTYFLILLFTIISTPIWAQAEINETRPTVGVVLSGGGAKGVAHISVLKAIENAGIPVDIVVGTSMGSLIGGLYSIGYTTDQLDSIVRNVNWRKIITNELDMKEMSYERRNRSNKYVISMPFGKRGKPIIASSLLNGQRVTNLLSKLTTGYHDSIDFNTLKRKFACVTTNVVDGKEVVLNSGVLYKAMRASMAVPGVFEDIRINGMVLVDGGIRNNFPVDVAKKMGADIVIGVDVGDELYGENELNSMTAILGQIVTIACKTKLEENIALTDVYIKVDVTGFSATSFNAAAVDSLISRGEKASQEHYSELLALKEKMNLPAGFRLEEAQPFKTLGDNDTIVVKKVEFVGIKNTSEKNRISKNFELTNDSLLITPNKINEIVSNINGFYDYSSVNYELDYNDDGYILTFFVKEKKENSINLGLRYDSEEKLSALINLDYSFQTKIPTMFSATWRIGDRTKVRTTLSTFSKSGYGLELDYKYENNDISIYKDNERLFNENYIHHQAQLNLFSIFFQKTKVKIGLRYDYYHFRDFLVKQDIISYYKEGEIEDEATLYKNMIDIFNERIPSTDKFISYFMRTYYNSFNKRNYPTHGSYITSEVSLNTDNMLTLESEVPLFDIMGYWQKAIPINRRFTLLPTLCGRFLIYDKTVPYEYLNSIGGFQQGRYSLWQLPFVGISHSQFVNDNVLTAKLDLRARIIKKMYATIIGNGAFTDNEPQGVFTGDQIWGGGITLGYDSFFGPLEISAYSHSSLKNIGLYINLGFYF